LNDWLFILVNGALDSIFLLLIIILISRLQKHEIIAEIKERKSRAVEHLKHRKSKVVAHIKEKHAKIVHKVKSLGKKK
jgi:uncharacterized membrane protein